MSLPLEKMLSEALGDLENISPNQLHQLIQEGLQTFRSLSEKSRSQDAKEREEAQKEAALLKEVLYRQAEDLSKAAGIDLTGAAAEDRDLFNPETWQELSSAKKELESFRDRLTVRSPKHSPSKKNKATWLH